MVSSGRIYSTRQVLIPNERPGEAISFHSTLLTKFRTPVVTTSVIPKVV
jgi:hypothetical protein